MPAPQAASSLTIAPLNTQPPLHLPATATQTAASEALLELWDNGDPSGMAGFPASTKLQHKATDDTGSDTNQYGQPSL